MEVKEQVSLAFHGVTIVRVNFESEDPMADSREIDLKINPRVIYRRDDALSFKIVFDVDLKTTGFFNLSLQAIGHFSTEKEVEKNVRDNFVNVNAPAIMFPYLRSFITTLTSNVGSAAQPLILPTYFFKGPLEEIILGESNT